MIFISAYSFIRFAYRYFPQVNRFMFIMPSGWDKHIDRPRMYINIIGFFFMLFSYKNLISKEPNEHIPEIYFNILFLLLFILGALICHFTWTKKFKNAFIPKVQEKLKTKFNFDIKISEQQLATLFNQLVLYGILDEKQTTLEVFKIVLMNDWNSHNNSIYFNLDGPGINEFYNLLKDKFPNNSLTIKNFISTSEVIKNSKKNSYLYNTITKARNRTNESKYSKKLQIIFSKI